MSSNPSMDESSGLDLNVDGEAQPEPIPVKDAAEAAEPPPATVAEMGDRAGGGTAAMQGSSEAGAEESTEGAVAAELDSGGCVAGNGSRGDRELEVDVMEVEAGSSLEQDGSGGDRNRGDGLDGAADFRGAEAEVEEVSEGTGLVDSDAQDTTDAVVHPREQETGDGRLCDQKVVETDAAEERVTVDTSGAVSDVGDLETVKAETGDRAAALMEEDVSHSDKERNAVVDTEGRGSFFGDAQSAEGAVGPAGQEPRDGLVGDDKLQLNVVESQHMVDTAEAAVDVGVEEVKGEQLGNTRDAKEMPVDVEIDNGNEPKEEDASSSEKNHSMVDSVISCASVDVHPQAIAHVPDSKKQGMEDGVHDDLNLKADAEEAGSMLGTAEADEGVAQVEVGEISEESKLIEEAVPYVEQKQTTTASDAASCDLMDGHIDASEDIPCSMELKEDRQGGDQKLGSDIQVAVSIVETGEAPVAAFLEASKTISSEGVLNSGGAQLDIGERGIQTELIKEEASFPGKNHSDPDDEKCYDSVGVHVQEKESSLNLGDTGLNQAGAVVEIAAGKEDVGSDFPVEIKEDSASKTMCGSSEAGNAAMPEAFQEGHHEALVLHQSPDSGNSDAQEVGCSDPMRKTEVCPVPLDEPVVDETDLIMKDSDLVEPAVEAQNPDSKTDNETMIMEQEVVTAESATVTNLPFAEAENGHDHVLIDDQRDFETTEVASCKPALGNNSQKSDTYPGDENVVAGLKLASDAVFETERKGAQLVGENPSDRGDVIMPDACFLVQTQDANVCPHGESLMDKGHVLTKDDDSVELNLLNPSESPVASQGKRGADSLLSENQKPEIESMTSLGDEDLDTNTHEAEPSVSLPEVMVGQSYSQNLDAESEALKADIPTSEVSYGQEVEVFQKLDGNRETPMLADGDVNMDIDVGTDGGQKVQAGEQELLRRINKQIVRHDGTSTMDGDQRARYYMSPEENDSFSASHLVWGKVKSHPWWPGQIFDSSYASEMALRHQRKDCFLVAYFGDKTFAWCEEAQLKPFQKYFSQMEKQSSSDAYVNAVSEVLEEVSRRIELGMSCCCLSQEAYANIEYEKVENAGIQEGTCNSFIDRSHIVNGFQPGSLLEFIQALAQFPNGGADRLDLVIALAQLKAFYHSKGYPELPVFLVCQGLVENDVDILPCSGKESDKHADEHSTQTLSSLISGNRKKRGRKRKFIEEKNIMENGTKQKSLFELMEEETIFNLMNGSRSGSEVEVAVQPILHFSSKKYNVVDSDSGDAGQSKKKRLDSLGDLETKSPSTTPNCSFKVGEWIRRAASQLTGSVPILKSCSEKFRRRLPKADHIIDDDFGADPSLNTPPKTLRRRTGHSEEHYSPNELLSQLCLAARNPMKGYSFLSTVVSFFTEFRKSCSSSSKDKKHTEKMGGKRGRKRRAYSNIVSPPASSDTSTPDHMQDSYWSDMIFHDSPEEKLLSNGLKRKGESHMRRQKRRRKYEVEPADSLALGPVSETARPFQLGALGPNMKQEWSAERPMIILEEKIVDECTPTELVLNFNKPDSIPSETDLIRIFSRYGPLKEAETEVSRKSNHAKVVFKKRADAEIAFSSAGKFSIFGPALFSYKLRYLPSAPKASVDTMAQGKRDTAPIDSETTEVPAQAEASASAVRDPVQMETGAVAMAEPAQSEAETVVVSVPVQAETTPPAVADPAHIDTITVAVAETETGALLVADRAQPETGELEVAGRAPLEAGNPPEIDPETGALKEADPAQAETSALAEAGPAQAETGEVAVAEPAQAETGAVAVADPAQAETKVLAVADSTEVEATS